MTETVKVLIADCDLIRRQLLTRELQRHSPFKIDICSNDVPQCKEQLLLARSGVFVWAGNSLNDSKQMFASIAEITNLQPTLRTIALMESWDRDAVITAFRCGVRGLFCLGESNIDDLRRCILAVHRNQVWATSEQLLMLIDAFKRSPVVRMVNVQGTNLLTARQQQLVELVAEGMGNREVAQRLGITENTVKKSLLRIFDKVGVSNRVELILSALAYRDQQGDEQSRVLAAKSPHGAIESLPRVVSLPAKSR